MTSCSLDSSAHCHIRCLQLKNHVETSRSQNSVSYQSLSGALRTCASINASIFTLALLLLTLCFPVRCAPLDFQTNQYRSAPPAPRHTLSNELLPLASGLTSIKGPVDTIVEATAYLRHYGYLPHLEEKRGAMLTKEEFTEALRSFQRFAEIPDTGKMDPATVAKMHVPRCGVPDVEDESQDNDVRFIDHLMPRQHNRKKRFAIEGSYWGVKNITYRITQYTKEMTKDQVETVIQRAFKVWSEHSPLNFVKQKSGGNVNIEVKFVNRSHGDGEPFDGRGQILAHAFFPRYGGDVHFDDEEPWTYPGGREENVYTYYNRPPQSTAYQQRNQPSTVRRTQHYRNPRKPASGNHRSASGHGRDSSNRYRPPRKPHHRRSQHQTPKPSYYTPQQSHPVNNNGYSSGNRGRQHDGNNHATTSQRAARNRRYQYRRRQTKSRHAAETKPKKTRYTYKTRVYSGNYRRVEPLAVTSPGIDLYSVAAHEIGHSLGLKHSNNHAALMAPFYQGYTPGQDIHLHADDITAIQTLYGEPVGGKEPPVARPTPKPSARRIGEPINICEDPALDAVTVLGNGTTYAFKGGFYWKLNNLSFDDGYPRNITEDWDGLPGDLDASVTDFDGDTYFFKNKQYWLYDANGQRYQNYPRSISDGLVDTPDDIDAAMIWNYDDKPYFFKDNNYWLYSRWGMPRSWPRRINEISSELPNKIDAAVKWTNDKTYVFSGPYYYRLTGYRRMQIVPGYPRDIAEWWFGCKDSKSQRTKREAKDYSDK